MSQYRQGDVFLVAVDQVPSEAVPVAGRLILAHGEVTGHAHEILSKYADLREHAGRRYLRVKRPVTLRHQEHDSIALPPGAYEVQIQREYSPESIRNVAD